MIIIREKKNKSAPDIIAPIILVAAKVMPSKITDVNIVPKTPAKNVLRKSQQWFLSPKYTDDVIRVIPRYTTAIPNNTHKNAGVTVMTAV